MVCTASAFQLFFALIKEAGPARATVITFVNPAVAILLGVLILDEPFTVGIAIGFPLVILGAVLATSRNRPVAEPPPRRWPPTPRRTAPPGPRRLRDGGPVLVPG